MSITTVKGSVQKISQKIPPADSQLKKSTSAINGEKATTKEAQRVSEDLLYGARVYSKLSSKNGNSGERFLALFKKSYSAISRYKTPIYDTVEKVLRALQREKAVSSSERTSLKLSALATADTDPNPERLDGTVSLAEVNNLTHKKPWTTHALDKFRSFRKKITMTTTTQTSNKKTSPAASKKNFSSTIPTTSIQGLSGFLWKPISDSDGKLAILLPSSLNGLIASVSLVDPVTGKILESGRYTGVGNGDRTHFRFSRPGASYPSGVLVKITLDDGSYKMLSITKPQSRVESKG